MSQEGVSKDVEDRLRSERKRHRRKDAVPWPAKSNQTSTALYANTPHFLNPILNVATYLVISGTSPFSEVYVGA